MKLPTYREGECYVCGRVLGGRGVLCDHCYIGRAWRDPHHWSERLASRLARLAERMRRER